VVIENEFIDTRCVSFGVGSFGSTCFASGEFMFDSCRKELICAVRDPKPFGGAWIGNCRERCDEDLECGVGRQCYLRASSESVGWCGADCLDIFESEDCFGGEVCHFDRYWNPVCTWEFFDAVGPGESPGTGQGCVAGTIEMYVAGICEVDATCCVPLCDPTAPSPASRCDELGYFGANCVELVAGPTIPAGICMYE
jgi:hypothetical protein